MELMKTAKNRPHFRINHVILCNRKEMFSSYFKKNLKDINCHRAYLTLNDKYKSYDF